MLVRDEWHLSSLYSSRRSETDAQWKRELYFGHQFAEELIIIPTWQGGQSWICVKLKCSRWRGEVRVFRISFIFKENKIFGAKVRCDTEGPRSEFILIAENNGKIAKSVGDFYRNLNLMTVTLPTSRWKRGRNRWCFSLLSEPFDWSLGHLIKEWPRWNIWSVLII